MELYVKRKLKYIEMQGVEGKPATQARQVERSASLKLLEEHDDGMRDLMEWIFGAGEKWLLTLHEIGESYDDARQLLKEHNELEYKSRVRGNMFNHISYHSPPPPSSH